MARFLGGLNEEIAGFVEMFPYHSLCKILLIKLSAQREKFSKRHVGNLIPVILLLPRGVSSSPILLLVEDGRMVQQQGPLHPMLLQRWRFLWHHLWQISSGLLQVQQPKVLIQLLHPLYAAEKLSATSAMVEDILQPNVQVEGP
jgi:hypothetical protein